MEVTDILRDRQNEPAGGFAGMFTLSIAVHALFLGAFFVAPSSWFSHSEDAPRTLMTISLNGGGDEPRNGGVTAMGGRPVQVQTPPEDVKRPEAVRPPAAKTPEMTVPAPAAKPTKASSTAVKQAPDDARGRTPTKGEETSAGSATAMTGARGQGFGLSTGGGPGTGATLDVADFCCPDYVVTMIEQIKANWNAKQGVDGQTVIKFTIRRDGTIQAVSIERSSGYPLLDLEAQRAVLFTKQLPPLPGTYQTLPVHVTFAYQR